MSYVFMFPRFVRCVGSYIIPVSCNSISMSLCLALAGLVFICVRRCSYVFIGVHMCSKVFICVHMCTYVYIFVHLGTSLYILVHFCPYLYICVHLCTFLHICTKHIVLTQTVLCNTCVFDMYCFKQVEV